MLRSPFAIQMMLQRPFATWTTFRSMGKKREEREVGQQPWGEKGQVVAGASPGQWLAAADNDLLPHPCSANLVAPPRILALGAPPLATALHTSILHLPILCPPAPCSTGPILAEMGWLGTLACSTNVLKLGCEEARKEQFRGRGAQGKGMCVRGEEADGDEDRWG